MRIQKFSCEHYRGFHGSLDFDFAKDLNVFFGENGAGKSTILDALATLLSWVVVRTRTTNASGTHISEFDINNEERHSLLRFGGSYGTEDNFSCQLVKVRRGHSAKGKQSNVQLKGIVDFFRNKITSGEGGLPVLAYYPVDRAVLDVPARIRKKHDFGILETYDQALTRAVNFRLFFEWFREREDIENASFRWKGEKPSDPQLQSVRRAIGLFMPEFSEWKICRKPQGMEVKKDGKTLRIEQLSSGEKCLMAMVGDIARRLAIANPHMDDPLYGMGIVLLDEIELHLHPSWQRMILQRLLKTFPHIQFFVSTHSPQIIGEAHANSNGHRVFRLRQTKEGIRHTTPPLAYGLDSNFVLDTMMTLNDDLSRNVNTTKDLHNIHCLIDDEKFVAARECIEKLEEKIGGTIPETIEASSLIYMLDSKEEAI